MARMWCQNEQRHIGFNNRRLRKSIGLRLILESWNIGSLTVRF